MVCNILSTGSEGFSCLIYRSTTALPGFLGLIAASSAAAEHYVRATRRRRHFADASLTTLDAWLAIHGKPKWSSTCRAECGFGAILPRSSSTPWQRLSWSARIAPSPRGIPSA